MANRLECRSHYPPLTFVCVEFPVPSNFVAMSKSPPPSTNHSNGAILRRTDFMRALLTHQDLLKYTAENPEAAHRQRFLWLRNLRCAYLEWKLVELEDQFALPSLKDIDVLQDDQVGPLGDEFEAHMPELDKFLSWYSRCLPVQSAPISNDGTLPF